MIIIIIVIIINDLLNNLYPTWRRLDSLALVHLLRLQLDHLRLGLSLLGLSLVHGDGLHSSTCLHNLLLGLNLNKSLLYYHNYQIYHLLLLRLLLLLLRLLWSTAVTLQRLLVLLCKLEIVTHLLSIKY